MTHTFISSPVSVLTGDAARVALQSTNDSVHYTKGQGVLSVPWDRWYSAQAYEVYTWMTSGLSLKEDRNTEHAAMFDGYKPLPHKLGDVIELGCGPFTNLRFILPGRKASSVTLLDPLIREYLMHPHCAYQDYQLCDHDVIAVRSAIEDTEERAPYDTLVMINVLSHCQSVDAVFAWITAHLTTGGYLIFHEPARDIDPMRHYDRGHPLSYTQEVIDEFLSGYTQVYRNGDYFIGVKK